MPKGLHWGKVEDLDGMCRKMAMPDGEIALLKTNALIKAMDTNLATTKHQAEELGLDTEIYNPENLEQLIDCLVHHQIMENTKSLLGHLDSALNK